MGGVTSGAAVKQAPEAPPIESSLGALARRAAHDEQAFRELYDRMKRPLYTFIYRMVGHMGEAEELFQDTLLKIHRNLGRLDDRDSFLAWCYSIARNTAISHLRRRKAITESIDDRPELEAPPNSHEETEVQLDLRKILMQIPPRYRSLFILGVLEQREYQEISRMTGKSLASVKIDIHRARQMVRERWERLRKGGKL